MPVNYAALNSDPYQQQKLWDMVNTAKFLAEQRQKEGHLAAEQKRDDQATRQKELELIGKQAEVLGQALDSVTDEKSWQAYRNLINQIGQTPLGQGGIWPRAMKETPFKYDPRLVAENKRFMASLVNRSGGQEIARSPEKTSTTGQSTLPQKLDDWRSDFNATKSFSDPEIPNLIIEGPESDPDLYRNQYNDISAIQPGQEQPIIPTSASVEPPGMPTLPELGPPTGLQPTPLPNAFKDFALKRRAMEAKKRRRLAPPIASYGGYYGY